MGSSRSPHERVMLRPCLALLQMGVTRPQCYHLRRWSLTPPFHPYLLFASKKQAVRFLLHFLSEIRLCKKLTAADFCPVITRHFFRRSPDFFLIIRLYHQKRTKRLYPICFTLNYSESEGSSSESSSSSISSSRSSSSSSDKSVSSS